MSFVMEYWDGSGSRVLTAFLMYSRSKALGSKGMPVLLQGKKQTGELASSTNINVSLFYYYQNCEKGVKGKERAGIAPRSQGSCCVL